MERREVIARRVLPGRRAADDGKKKAGANAAGKARRREETDAAGKGKTLMPLAPARGRGQGFRPMTGLEMRDTVRRWL
jgi:hypothetical protein